MLTGVTIPLSGVIKIDLPVSTLPFSSGTPPFVFTEQLMVYSASATGWAIEPLVGQRLIEFNGFSTAVTTDGFHYVSQYTWTLTLNLPSGGHSISLGAPTTWDGSATCTMSWSIDMLADASYGEGGLPGGSLEDLFFTEGVKVGGAWSLSITAGSAGTSASGTLVTADANDLILTSASYIGLLSATSMGGGSGANRGPTPSSCSVSQSVRNQALGVPKQINWNFPVGSPANGPQVVNVDFTNGVFVNSTVNTGPALYNTQPGAYGGILQAQFPTSFSINAQLFQLDKAYPGSVPIYGMMHGTTAGSFIEPPNGTPIDAYFSTRDSDFPWLAEGGVCSASGQFQSPSDIDPATIIKTFPANPYLLSGFAVYADGGGLLQSGEQPFEITEWGNATPPITGQVFEMFSKPFPMLSVSYDQTPVWDDLLNLTPWGFPSPAGWPNLTNELPGIEIQFDTSMDSSGNPVTQWWVEAAYQANGVTLNISGYRYLQFTINSQVHSNVNFTVQIVEGLGLVTPPGETPDKFWNCQTGPAGDDVTITIDLCAPNSGGPASQTPPLQQDSQLGQTDPAGYLGPGMQNGWGVCIMNTFRLNFPDHVSDQYQLKFLNMLNVETPKWSFLEEPLRVMDSGGTPPPPPPPIPPPPPLLPFRIATVDMDGRRGLEIPWWAADPGDPPPPIPTAIPYNITQTVAQINSQLGFIASSTLPGTLEWNMTNESRYLGGNGGIFGGQDWIETPDTTVSVQGQIRTNWLFCPPGVGDVFMSGGGTGTVPVPCRLRLRGAITGLTLDDTGQPVPNTAVQLLQNGVQRGATVSDDEARFLTGPTYPVAGVEIDIPTPLSLVGAQIKTGVSDRLIRRIGTGLNGCTQPYIWQDVSGQLSKHCIKSQDLWFYRSDSTTPLPAWIVNARVTTTKNILAGTHLRDQRGIYYIVYNRTDNTAWEQISYDDGLTWTDPVAMALPTPCNNVTNWQGHDGSMLRAAHIYLMGTSGPGNIMATYQGVGDPSQSSVFPFMDDTGSAMEFEDAGFQVALAHDGVGRWTLSALIHGESATSDWQCWDMANIEGTGQGTWTRMVP